jgi:hypothetical protein
VEAALLIFGIVVIGGAVDARRRLPNLESWHRYTARCDSLISKADLADYLRRKTSFFGRARSDRTHVDRIGVAAGQPATIAAADQIPRASVGTVTAHMSSCPAARLPVALS